MKESVALSRMRRPGPKEIYAHLLGDLLVVRLQGVLTAAEQHLVKSLSRRQGEGSAPAGADASDRNAGRSSKRWSSRSPASRC